MNVLDLFSGIGGFSLGLERAGMRTVAFCEIDPYCQAVLRKHWPDVPIWGDVRSLTVETLADAKRTASTTIEGTALVSGELLEESGRSQAPNRSCFGGDGSGIDVICGGFPCQDISVAGKGADIEGERSGLWSEYARIIGEVRPRYVIVENVAALLGRGLSRVLGDLAALGFDAEWHCIPASAVGAPHRRDRVWIIANARSSGGRPDAPRYELSPESTQLQSANGQARSDNDATLCGDVADAASGIRQRQTSGERGHASFGCENVANTKQPRLERSAGGRMSRSWGASIELAGGDWWLTEPDVGRVANGVPLRVDRLRSLGNSIVPQIAEIIGKAIMQWD